MNGDLNLAAVIDRGLKVYSFPTMGQAEQFKRNTTVGTGGMVLVTRGEAGLKGVAKSFLREIIVMTGIDKDTGGKRIAEVAYQAMAAIAENKMTVNDQELLAYPAHRRIP